jgi:hypothetical protein
MASASSTFCLIKQAQTPTLSFLLYTMHFPIFQGRRADGQACYFRCLCKLFSFSNIDLPNPYLTTLCARFESSILSHSSALLSRETHSFLYKHRFTNRGGERISRISMLECFQYLHGLNRAVSFKSLSNVGSASADSSTEGLRDRRLLIQEAESCS